VITPFSTKIDPIRHVLEGYTNFKETKLSSLRDYFSQPEEVDRLLKEKGDITVYKYYEKVFEEGQGNLNFGITILYPGKVGKEYFMTRGHFHDREAAEIYYGMQGEGVILMQSSDGEVEWKLLEPNSVVYVPPGWGHRTINTGSSNLVFFFLYPSDAGHNYEIVREKGFAKIIIEENGYFKVVENPRYLSSYRV